MLQPEDPVESAGPVGAGGRSGGCKYRAGSRGHQPGQRRAQAVAGRRISGLERAVCM